MTSCFQNYKKKFGIVILLVTLKSEIIHLLHWQMLRTIFSLIDDNLLQNYKTSSGFDNLHVAEKIKISP